MKRLLAGVVALAFSTGAAQALPPPGACFGSDGTYLYSIDKITGVCTSQGALGINPVGIQWFASHYIYALDSNGYLYQYILFFPGLAKVFIGDTGIVTSNSQTPVGLVYATYNGTVTLYTVGVSSTGADLYAIDERNASTTHVGYMGPYPQISTLTYGQSILYASDNNANPSFYQIDFTSGATTVLNNGGADLWLGLAHDQQDAENYGTLSQSGNPKLDTFNSNGTHTDDGPVLGQNVSLLTFVF